MKKYLLIFGCIATLSLVWADTPTSCANFGSSASGCNACFTGSAVPYEGDGITASDRYTNTSTNFYQYLWVGAGYFDVAIQELNAASWERSQTSLAAMFEIPMYTSTSNGVPYILYFPGESSNWIRTKTGQYFRFANHGNATSRSTPVFKIAYTVKTTPQNISTGVSGATVTHTECSFYTGKWCGDGVIDADHGEQCDNGANNGTNGTCSSTCQNNQVLSCNAITVTPGTLTALGGTLNASCAGTNATQYKFVLKEGLNTIQTVDYQAGSTTSFTIPANTLNQTKNFTVQCYVKNNNATDVTNNPSCIGGSTQGSANLAPQIVIDKRDANSADIDGVVGNDTQTVAVGNGAVFKIRVTNNGTEDLNTLVLTDAVAPNCGGSVTLPGSYPSTWSNFVTAGSGNNTDNILQVGEYFEYICDKGNTTGNYTNSATVAGKGVTSRVDVTSTDTTPVIVQNTTTTCNDLSLTTSGNTVSYTCTGSNVSNYSIQLDGSVINSASSGSTTLSNGTHTFICYVNGSITSASCQKSVTISPNPTPQILIDKRDANTADTDGVVGNDTQTVTVGNAAVFKIRVTNNGTEDLKSINLSDSVAPNCGGGITLPGSYPSTWSNFVTAGSGSHTDNILQVGEYFEYTCDKGNTTGNYTNSATVNAQGNTSNIAVTSTDTTPVIVQNAVTTCNDLTLSTSGNTVSYSCTGTNATSYSIQLNGSVINSSPSGSTTVGYGTHTFICYVNGSISSASCQKTVTLTPNQTYPQIQVIKDDSDNHDDQQQVNIGGAAQFSVVVRNPGQEALDTVNLSDQLTPECNRNASDTVNMIMAVGNRDARLDPGESFSYICAKSSVNQSTFPNYENRICVNGRGITSGNTVNSCDTTRINLGVPPTSTTCQDIQIAQNGNQVNVTCSPNGGYRLFVLRGKQVLNTFQNPQGQFSFGLDDGSYKVVCLRDGDNGIQPGCQKSITINPHNEPNTCTLSSSLRYGGAPLHTRLNCSSDTSSQCTIRINKDGEPWQTLYDCSASMTFNQKGLYEATCYMGDNQEESCSTDIQVDIMTIIKTGPFLPIIIVIAMGTAGYITYRRRKTV